MCLGIPGELKERVAGQPDLALVEVSGARRVVNVALLEGEPLAEGDWLLIHVGFAMAKIDEDEARATLASLERLGAGYPDELRALDDSPSHSKLT